MQRASYMGLYEVTGRQCSVPQVSVDSCSKIKFIEFVQGQFYGVNNNDVALVMWRGDKGEELLYQARKIGDIDEISQLTSKIILSTDDITSENILLVDGLATEYDYSVASEGDKYVKSHKIHYTLKPVKRGLLPGYRMNYPGND